MLSKPMYCTINDRSLFWLKAIRFTIFGVKLNFNFDRLLSLWLVHPLSPHVAGSGWETGAALAEKERTKQRQSSWDLWEEGGERSENYFEKQEEEEEEEEVEVVEVISPW
jgi:hypothetical protein